MHEPARVRFVEHTADVAHDAQHARRGQRTRRVEFGAQGAALEAFHHEEGAPGPRDPDVMHGDDVGMREAGRRLRLVTEALCGVSAARHCLADDLHGHGPVEFLVAGRVDGSHATRADA